MQKKITIHCKNTNQQVEIPIGSTLLEVQTLLDIKMPYLIVNARVNNKTESLDYEIFRPKTVEFVDISESSGMRTYVRSLCFILAKAVAEIFPKAQMNINHPISKGYYCTISGCDKISETEIDLIKNKMRSLIAAKLPFEALEDETDHVAKIFREQGLEDKATLLETSDSVYSKYYKLGDYFDYFYGCLVPDSSYISIFDIEPFYDGILLRVPNRNNPVELEPMIHQDKMYRIYDDQTKFLNVIGLETVGDLNQSNQSGKMPNIIKVSEALQEKTIAGIASNIASRFDDGVRVVLIAGPSSSGKTTFRKRLEVQLMANLITPVGLSLDDYFIDREKTPIDSNGDYDFESLYALDLELFNSNISRVLNGERVELPSYNFTTGRREYKGNYLQIEKHNVLVIEGIHGLNPELTKQIDDNQKFLIYVSALTSISLDNHNWIPTTDNRLLRRLVRDYKYRNYSAIDTLSRWNSVRKGEDKWIFPFQENADVMFNSAMLYELAALRKYAEPILMQVPKKANEYAEAYRLLKFLSYFNYINDKELPPTSLLREFLGGSSFKY